MDNYAKLRVGIGIFLLSFLFVMPLAYAADPSAVAAWWGNVTIGTNKSTNGANISAYINSALIVSKKVGEGCYGDGCVAGIYVIDVPCNQSDTVVLTVYNITASSPTCNLNKSLLNLTVSKLADSVACAWSDACSGGYCCSGATEYNGNGVGACQATACSAAPTPSGDGGGGGGGGAGAGVVSQSKYTGSIAAGGSKSVSFTRDELKVTSVEVTTNEKVDNMGITVKESSAPAANLAIATEEGKAYKYLEITKTVEDKSIRQAKISFKVEKSWFESNGLNPATTVLKKLVNNVWQELPTIKTSEDATYVYFEATSETLSLFAITAKKTVAVVTPPTPPVAPYCGDAVCNATAGENCATCIQDCTCKSGEECKAGVCEAVPIIPIKKPTIKTLIRIVSIILIILIIVIAGIMLSRKRR